jgi:mRNA-degrading endonuclease RelE of RelBE toxin-antitoxin system
MQFRIADSFTKALGKLNADEQKAVKITVFDLQQDPANPSLQFHRIEKSKDKNFWSMRVNRDIRLIIHKTAASLLICYVDHHDDAYSWAERRRIETHPKTGAAQIVEVRERVEEIAVPVYVPATPEEPLPQDTIASALFRDLKADDLLDVGVPQDWLNDVQQASEERFFEIADHIPSEAAEALLNYAATGRLHKPEAIAAEANPFEHPDAQRRFRVLENKEELERALDYPWDQWTVFLHPSQRQVVEQSFSGPARVSGSAGTGKTVVALHRAANILKNDSDARVLLTTFSSPLSNALKAKVKLLSGIDCNESTHISVHSFQGVARDLFTLARGHDPRPATWEQVAAVLESAKQALGDEEFTLRFLNSEWNSVIDAWQIDSLDAYRDVPRLGRKNRMGSKQRERVWPIFVKAREILRERGLETWSSIFAAATDHFTSKDYKPFTHIIVDEAQDLGVPELRMLAAIAEDKHDALFFAGDLGQRIFQEPFSWKTLGVDIRGRSQTLKVNYRTSHQIRQTADKLLPETVRDVDGIEEDRRGTVSVFNGPAPSVQLFEDQEAEREAIAEWINATIADGIEADEIGIFVRSHHELGRARDAVKAAGGELLELSERVEETNGRISIGTMHLAKGLEFKAVVAMACDNSTLPLQERIDSAADEFELSVIFDTERHLFYVACTRARDRLLITGVEPGSEFIADLNF